MHHETDGYKTHYTSEDEGHDDTQDWSAVQRTWVPYAIMQGMEMFCPKVCCFFVLEIGV